MHRRAQGRPRKKPAVLVPEQGETIAAISTPPGEGAIAIVRLSGAQAIAVAEQIFRGPEKPGAFQANVQHLGEIVEKMDAATAAYRVIDQVLLSVHRAPASYTGEDLVEISCHGGTLVSARILEACLRAGARAARAGEFTERAFLNGKMDLTQAEAVIDLIRAKTDLALRAATEQLEGKLGARIRHLRDELVALSAHVAASIDFSEEDIAPDEGEKLRARLDSVRAEMTALLETAEQGRILREGVRVVIYGATNAGKSSLLNRLLGYERVIVSEAHGTTRDTIEEMINLRGVPIRLLDTAGLREAGDQIERAGIARTEKSLQIADLRLHIADRSAPRPPHFDEETGDGAEMLLLNKSDLSEHSDWRNVPALRLSCVTGEGMAELEDQLLVRIAGENLHPENAIAINTRHRDCLRRAVTACERALAASRQNAAPEYLAVDLKESLDALGEIVGVSGVENILDSVFANFCIGK